MDTAGLKHPAAREASIEEAARRKHPLPSRNHVHPFDRDASREEERLHVGEEANLPPQDRRAFVGRNRSDAVPRFTSLDGSRAEA